MVLIAAVALLALPFVELYLAVQIAHVIGVLDTLGLLVLVPVVGAYLVRRQGLATWRRIREQVAYGEVPGTAVIDAFLILLGGVLLLVPGFLTDAIGLLLLVPPVRAGVRAFARWLLARRIESRVVRRF
jgi:UPF0716 protein FxsA